VENKMNAKEQRKAALCLIEPLVDAFQMRLILRDQNSKFSIYGSGEFALPLQGESTMTLKCDVKASNVKLGQEAWVLVKVSKDLYVFLLYSVLGGILSLAIIDGALIEALQIETYKGAPASIVMAALAKKTKALFQRDRFKSEWSRTDALPNIVDQRQDSLSKERNSATIAGWGY